MEELRCKDPYLIYSYTDVAFVFISPDSAIDKYMCINTGDTCVKYCNANVMEKILDMLSEQIFVERRVSMHKPYHEWYRAHKK